MLVLFRKSGQGVEVKSKEGKRFDFDFLHYHSASEQNEFKINGKTVFKKRNDPFYLDEEEKVLVVVVKYGFFPRFGIDAPKEYLIKRKELL